MWAFRGEDYLEMTVVFLSAAAVKYDRGGFFSGNGTAYVWASGSVLVVGRQAGSDLQGGFLTLSTIEINVSSSL